MPIKRKRRIVVIGGGTGSFSLLKNLKDHDVEVTALVNMVDDGGSTGVLRDELGVLPPGDVRQCLVALSQSSMALRELFNYRFPKGSTFAGHSFGNLFLSAVEMMSKDFGEAVNMASEVLNIKGRVVPVTLDNCHLVLETSTGVVMGEHAIGNMALERGVKPKLWLEPAAKINPAAEQAIATADLIVIAPGNLYGSLIPALLVDGMAEALRSAKGKVAYVCNLVNKPLQTPDYAVHNYIEELERFSGKGTIDYVLYNTDEPSKEVLEAYALDGEFTVKIDKKAFKKASFKAIPGHFLSRSSQERDANDTFILRSLIRHDSEAIAKALLKLAK